MWIRLNWLRVVFNYRLQSNRLALGLFQVSWPSYLCLSGTVRHSASNYTYNGPLILFACHVTSWITWAFNNALWIAQRLSTRSRSFSNWLLWSRQSCKQHTSVWWYSENATTKREGMTAIAAVAALYPSSTNHPLQASQLLHLAAWRIFVHHKVTM
jgi:hypothetical protein